MRVHTPDNIPFVKMSLVFWVLFALGILLTLPLYKFNCRKFTSSSVFTKILYWIPIFIVFLGILYIGPAAKAVILGTLLLAVFIEIILVARRSYSWRRALWYFVFLAVGLTHLALIGIYFADMLTNTLIVLAFATVLADVTAYFFGNYLGKHKLPSVINKKKSWEGVAGQIIGAFLGVMLTTALILKDVNLWLFLPIGIGSVIGDIVNSYIKRRSNITDWSQAIPGHGGITDRLSSLAGSALLVFYFLLLTK